MPNRAGRDRLVTTLKRILENKENKEETISGMLGRYNESGVKEINVSGRPGLVHVRVRGQTSELVQAFNETAGLQWGQPILLKKDPYSPRFYRVIGRDTGKYQEWPEQQQMPKHGRQHSFAQPSDAGRDIAFIYKRQMAQPLLAHPQSTEDMTVYVEPDFYFWNGQNQYFSGGSSPDLTSYKPADSFGRFVTVYLDGGTGTIKVSAGSTFSETLPPTNVVGQIPTIDPSVGIPLVAVYLTSTTTVVDWASLYDIRIMLFTAGGGIPAPHALDPIYGFHTGSLPARNVSVSDPSGVLSSQNVEDTLFELYNRTTGSISGWVDSGSVVRLETATDNVGIGTTGPRYKLDVEGAAVGSSFAGIDIRDPAAERIHIGYQSTGGAPTNNIVPAQILWSDAIGGGDLAGSLVIASRGNAASGIAFHTSAGTSLAERVRIDRNGNVGIGTTSPGYKLDVRGAIVAGDGTIKSMLSYSAYPVIGALSNQNLGIYAGGVEKVTIDTGGNVGIGTTGPGAKLHVAGAVRFDGNLDLSNADVNLILGSTTGTKIGTATTQKLGFFNKTPVVQQAQGATLTNNVTSGGTANQLDDFTSLTVYATDAAAIRNDIYRLGQTLKTVVDALRTYGLLS